MRTKTNVPVRCIDCGAPDILDMPDGRAQPRCPVCAVHYDRRARYTNPIQKARSQYLTQVARKDRRRAKHCPHCHHLRHRKEFLNFNDPFGRCSVCRNEMFAERQRELRNKRYGI